MLAVLLIGCGPIRAGSVIVDAAAEVNAARSAEGEKNAPYEFIAAEAYLHKAREDHSYAKFESALLFARKSVDCARLARAIAHAEVRAGMGASAVKVPEGTRCRPGTSQGPGARESAGKIPEPTTTDDPADPQPMRPAPIIPPPAKPPADGPLPDGDAEK